jgi:hypothetical protein
VGEQGVAAVFLKNTVETFGQTVSDVNVALFSNGEAMKRLLAALILGINFALAGPMAAPAEESAQEPLKPCVVITGANSHITERRYCRITSADDWAQVWQEHRGEKPTGQYDLYYDPLTLPSIDFDRYMVIAIFQGNGWNSAGLRFISISEENGRMIFRFRDKRYQTGGSGADGGRKKATAYGFFVVPRSTKPIVLEEDMQNLIGEPPIWKERITFPRLQITDGKTTAASGDGRQIARRALAG